jgi:hypothetical protein
MSPVVYIGYQALSDSIAQFGPEHEFTKLVPSLENTDPDDSFSSIPYEKGFTLLYYLETLLGQATWDPFIREVLPPSLDVPTATNILHLVVFHVILHPVHHHFSIPHEAPRILLPQS